MNVIVIGGGAAGFFTAVNTARLNPKARVTIFEKGREVLSKVRISGGGRCNVTHHCFEPELLSAFYPRGGKMMRWNFEKFQPEDTIAWFQKRGVELKAEEDGRMFPVTDSSETIINCLLDEARKYKVRVQTKTAVKFVEPKADDTFFVHLSGENVVPADKVVVAAGGFSRETSYEWIKQLGHTIQIPIPSLFTFNFREKIFKDLAGISVEHAEICIKETRFSETGPVLFTHWGLSGPAVLKLSAVAARQLFRKEYRFDIEVNWLAPLKEQNAREMLIRFRDKHSKKQVNKQAIFPFPARLWEKFLELSGIDATLRWTELSNKQIHQLVQQLIKGTYNIQGKTTYKDEFVTCGGVSLKEITPHTLESKKIPGIYFAGEVLDIDGITGGFNFQAAWTNAWLAAHDIAGKNA